MAVNANTLTTLQAVGNREDLSDDISRINPEKTPFYSNTGKLKGGVSATFTEHQLEELDPVNTDNAHLEGDDTAIEAANVRERIGTYTQIFKKSGSVAGTQEAVDTAGVEDELDRQAMLKGIAARRDMEAAFLSKTASRPQSGTNARKLAGALSWMETNVSRGATGANGGWNGTTTDAPTDGTLRTFEESQLEAVMLSRFNATGEITANLTAYMGGALKQAFGAFPGLSETRDAPKGNRRVIYGAADVYQSNFGRLTAVPHAYALDRDVLIADNSYWKRADLRPMTREPLPKTGDAEKFQMIGECTLVSRNQKASALIADVRAA